MNSQYLSLLDSKLQGTNILDLKYNQMEDSDLVPNKFQLAVHLKLLNSFRVLKDSVLVDVNNPLHQQRLWKCYVVVASRKFVLFISALKNKYTDDISFSKYMNTLLPPLDVILIWHSFLLNPKSCYENFANNRFSEFLKISFPWEHINESISNDKFIFIPSIDLSDEYSLLVDEYCMDINYENDFTYNCYQPFDISTISVPIYCSSCGQHLGTSCLTNLDRRGFADDDFEMLSSNCNCGFHPLIDHENLQSRKLMFDIQQEYSIPGLGRKISPELNKTSADIIATDFNMKSEITQNWEYATSMMLSTFLETFEANFTQFESSVLNLYLYITPISATFPSSTIFQVHEDLVSIVITHERFINKILQMLLINSPYIEFALGHCLERYHEFLQLIKLTQTKTSVDPEIVPALDIDLVWQTHQLNQVSYFKCCKQLTGQVIDHDERLESDFPWFADTCSLYKQKFGKEYIKCFCEKCLALRVKKSSDLEV